MNGLLARIETASFFEEERRKKDIVESGTGDLQVARILLLLNKKISF